MIDLKEMQKACYEIARYRAANDKHYWMIENIKNLAGEVVELQEAMTSFECLKHNHDFVFDGTILDELDYQTALADYKEAAEDELADVVIYALLIAEHNDFELEAALKRKIEENCIRAEKAICLKEDK